MKTWKLVSGILSIIMFVFVTFQSCAAGISNSNRIIWIGRNHGIHNGWKLHRPYNLGSLVCNLCSISTYLNDKKAKTDRRKLIKTAILKQIRGQRIKLKGLIPM